MMEITESQPNDSLQYIERSESEVQRRIANEYAIKELKVVMKEGCARDLEVLHEQHQFSASGLGWKLINELIETCPIENLRWFFGNLVPVDTLAPYSHVEGYTLLAYRLHELAYCCFGIEDRDMQAIGNLIELGADVRAITPRGDTSLHLTANRNWWSDFPRLKSIIELLIDHGADINATNLAGKTVLMCADEPEVADFLIRQPDCQLTCHKRHNSLVINKNNFKNAKLHKACQQLGGLAVAMSRIQQNALNDFIPVPTKTTDRPNPRDIEM